MNYTARARSNRFAVRDPDVFLADMARFPDLLVSDRGPHDTPPAQPPRFLLIADEDAGGWPTRRLRDTPHPDHADGEDWEDGESTKTSTSRT